MRICWSGGAAGRDVRMRVPLARQAASSPHGRRLAVWVASVLAPTDVCYALLGTIQAVNTIAHAP